MLFVVCDLCVDALYGGWCVLRVVRRVASVFVGSCGMCVVCCWYVVRVACCLMRVV